MRNIYCNSKKDYFLKILLFIPALFFFCAVCLYGEPIIKDNDFFVVYDTTSPLPQAAKVNRLDDAREFVQISSGFSYILNYDNLSYTQRFLERYEINYYSPDDSGYKNDGRVIKTARDINNDVYIAGNKDGDNSMPQGYDTISKYSNGVSKWSISPSIAEPAFIRPQGLVIPKNKDFLYAIYYGDETSNPCKIKIYKIDKNTGAGGDLPIYSSSVAKYASNNYHNNTEFLVDDDANIYILSLDNSFAVKRVKLQKIDSDGNQVFIKEIPNAYNCEERKLTLLENGFIFVLAHTSTEDRVSLIDSQGNVVKGVSIPNTYVDNALKNERKILVGADKDAMYYLCGDFKEQPDLTKRGFYKIEQYDYSGSLVKTIFLPGKIGEQYGNNDDIIGYERSISMASCFVKNKRLYVPSMFNGGKHYGYIVDINNPPILLRFSDEPDYENSIIGKFKAVEGENTVRFKAKYKNFSDKPPVINFPRICIYLEDIEIAGSPFVMTAVDPSDKDYAKGVEYEVEVPLILININDLNSVYTYNIRVEDAEGNSFISDKYTLYAPPSFVKDNKSFNYPNPFNPNKTSTKILFHTPKSENVKINIYSLNGKKIFEDTFNAIAGQNEYEYKGRDGNGKTLYNGVYLCVIEKSGGNAKCKIAIVK
ncbi:MAG: T9SS type A sorting domain-containing protein [Endomicrobium sp.]|nr:T9SS type A sorting domain-containing protein [Endomicrobium sp.]